MTDEDVVRWNAALAEQRNRGEAMELDPIAFAEVVGLKLPSEPFAQWLEQSVSAGELQRVEAFQCPNPACGQLISKAQFADGQCPHCQIDFAEFGEVPIPVHRYRIVGETSRDVHWMIVIHGMNSRAPWQEELSWRIANKFHYRAPVLIYKYGWATIDVLAPQIHEALAKELGRKIRKALDFAQASGITDVPDLLAHSFGTHLFTLVLRDPEFDDLRFGRVITVGSIVRPDFAWRRFIEAGRIEAVLNQVGSNDKWVQSAQYLIPGTGPGGYVGYVDPATTNKVYANFEHSTAFDEPHLGLLLAEGGLWDRFLRYPKAVFEDADREWPASWTPASWLKRALGRLIGGAMFALCLVPSGVRRLVDR